MIVIVSPALLLFLHKQLLSIEQTQSWDTAIVMWNKQHMRERYHVTELRCSGGLLEERELEKGEEKGETSF